MEENKRNEVLNFITGITLVIVGIVLFFKNDVAGGFNWLIFGSMYLVMDGYKTIEMKTSIFIITRNVFSFIGLLASLGVLIYYLIT
jgi:hypothetical protein